MSIINLLHGTDHIIEVPDIHIGNPHNDYGMGFYCTRVDEMAREWACKKNTDGFVNSYDFDTEGLKVLNLLDGTHTVLNWMALLLQFRTFKLDSEVAVDARDYLIDHYSIDLTGYDVVIGYTPVVFSHALVVQLCDQSASRVDTQISYDELSLFFKEKSDRPFPNLQQRYL